jgi:Ca2+-binding RTX toxin-like protein
MTTTIEYALMAGHAYRTTRDEINWIPAPDGWTPFFPVPDPTTAATFQATAGFEAISFIKGTEIVISYAGTAGLLSIDNVANADLALGALSPQLLQAAEYYLQVKAANPSATITLTGHSLGGGLAALIGVFFGVEAHSFDQAPFANSAEDATLPTSLSVGEMLKSSLLGKGYSETQLSELSSFLGLQASNGGIPNSNLVTNINTQGEFLSGVPWNVVDRIGTTVQNIANSAPPSVTGDDLHSQALLTAFLLSQQTAANGKALNDATFDLGGLMPLLFDEKLYAFETDRNNTENVNFLEHLVRHEAGAVAGIAAGGDAMLTRFTTDLWKLADANGLNLTAQTALIAQGIEWYYWQQAGYAGAEFFTQTTELLQYTTAQGAGLAGAQDKAANLVDSWLTPLYNAENEFGGRNRFDQWNVAAGSSGVSATALDGSKTQIFVGQGGGDSFTGGSRADMFLAGAGDDVLNGGAAADTLLAGTGADTLDGGLGNDTLNGGADFDTYTFSGLFGSDTIDDAGGQGSIVVTGLGNLTATGAKKTSATASTWQSEDKRITYSVVTQGTAVAPCQDLVITVAAGVTAGRITVRNWVDGQLGISLGAEVVQPATTNAFVGDYAKATNSDGSQYLVSTIDGNYLAAGAQIDAPDVLNGSAGDDWLQGLGGNDGLAGGAGDDVIDGGDGSDLLLGGWGADTISGGAGNDQIFGSDSGRIDQPASVNFVPPAATGVEIARGFSWVVYDPPGVDGNGLDAYEVLGGGNVLPSGEPMGNVIDSGAGDDNNELWGDGVANLDVYQYIPQWAFGNDVIDSGGTEDIRIRCNTWVFQCNAPVLRSYRVRRTNARTRVPSGSPALRRAVANEALQ